MPENIQKTADDLASRNFLQIARAYLPEITQLFRQGKLLASEGWDNVSAHCITQAVLAKELGLWLKLPVDEVNDLIRTALLHDWAKRLEVSPDDFSTAEKERANALFEELQINPELLMATDVEFVKKYWRNEPISFSQKLQFYLDNIVNNRTVTTYTERVNEVSKRRAHFSQDEQLTQDLAGTQYWDAHRQIGHAIEQEIFLKLREKGISVTKPEDIPLLLQAKLASQK